MSVTDTGPLDWRVAIVDKGGKPTPEFQRKWNTQRQNNDEIGSVTIGTGAPTGSPADGDEYIDDSVTPYILYVGNSGTWHQVGAVKFTDLSDTPANYTGAGTAIVRVNTGATALEFVGPSTVLDGFSSTQGSLLYRGAAGWSAIGPGTSGQFLKTNGTGADPAWAAASGGGGGVSYTGFNIPALSFSTAAFATKGRSWSPAVPVQITNVYAAGNFVSGHTLKCTIGTATTLPAASTTTIASILGTATVVAGTAPSTVAFDFSGAPISVSAGTIVLVLITDTNLATTTTALPISATTSTTEPANGPPTSTLAAIHTSNLFIQLASLNPGVGNSCATGGVASGSYLINIACIAGLTATATASNSNPLMNGTAAPGTSIAYTRADHVHPTDTSLLPLSGGTLTGSLSISTASNVFNMSGETNMSMFFNRYSTDASPPDMRFRKSRGTLGVPSTVATNDQLGVVNFQGYGASTYAPSASIVNILKEVTPTNTAMGSYLSFRVAGTGLANGSSAGAEVIRLDFDTGLNMYGANPVIDEQRNPIVRVYTVGTLPTGRATGTLAIVTNALTPAIGNIVAAGGAVRCLVNYDGTNWRVC